MSHDQTDIITWNCSTNGDFSIKSAVELKSDSYPSPNIKIWKLIWSWDGPQRVEVFFVAGGSWPTAYQ